MMGRKPRFLHNDKHHKKRQGNDEGGIEKAFLNCIQLIVYWSLLLHKYAVCFNLFRIYLAQLFLIFSRDRGGSGGWSVREIACSFYFASLYIKLRLDAWFSVVRVDFSQAFYILNNLSVLVDVIYVAVRWSVVFFDWFGFVSCDLLWFVYCEFSCYKSGRVYRSSMPFCFLLFAGSAFTLKMRHMRSSFHLHF